VILDEGNQETERRIRRAAGDERVGKTDGRRMIALDRLALRLIDERLEAGCRIRRAAFLEQEVGFEKIGETLIGRADRGGGRHRFTGFGGPAEIEQDFHLVQARLGC